MKHPTLPIVLAAILLSAGLLVSPLGSGIAHAKNVTELLDKAEELIDGGWYRTAIPLLEEAAEKAPGNGEVQFLLGVAYFEAGMNDAAQAAFKLTAQLDLSNWRALYNLGAGYFKAERWQLAAEAFLSIPERAPHMASSAYLNAGLSRYKQGQPDAAATLFEKVLQRQSDGANADSARSMLSLLKRPVPTLKDAPSGRRAARKSWRVTGGVGIDYDSNVFLAPDDQTTRNTSDFRVVTRLRADYQIKLGERFRLRPHYSLYNRWYPSESGANYTANRLRLRITEQHNRLRPRAEYSITSARLGGNAYLTTHHLGSRVTLLSGDAQTGVWAGLTYNLHDSPTNRYTYLTGQEWIGTLSGGMPVLARSHLYGALAIRILDRKDRFVSGTAAGFRSYSYTAFEPYLRLAQALPWWGMDLAVGLRYQYRSYQDNDTWTGLVSATPVSKGRVDHRFTASTRINQPLNKRTRLTYSLRTQWTQSNIGDSPDDYRNRDFTRTVLGVQIEHTW